MSNLQIRVCGRFKIQSRLYQGSNSSVYLGTNVQAQTDCAIKLEPKSSRHPFLQNQSKIVQDLQGGVGIPNLLWHGMNGSYYFMVSDLLGNNLQTYFKICNRKFSLKTVLMVFDKLLSTFEHIHHRGFLHRDIKPQNFCVGLGKKLTQIYCIDYAFSMKYAEGQRHLENTKNQNQFVGTLKFNSPHVLRGEKNSRKDDLFSLGLMMIYFLKGLPWQHSELEEDLTIEKVKERILQQMDIQKLCESLPGEFLTYMNYCHNLKYDQTPNYTSLKRLFKERFIKQGYQNDNVFDWLLIPLKLSDQNEQNAIPISRRFQKPNPSLFYCNEEHDFEKDLAYTESIMKRIVKTPVTEMAPKDSRKRAISQNTKPTKGKKKKDQECTIY